VYGGTLHPWDGRAPRVLDDSGLFEGGVEQVAARWAGGAWSTVAMVVQPRRAKRLLARGTTEAGDWEHRFTEPGGGAIDAQGNVACTPGGTRVVRVDSHGQVSSDRPLPEGIVIEQLVAVADALVAVDVDRRRLHTLSAEGAVQSTVTVPLAMAGPTVTGPGLRRYAVGEGIAAVEDGRILWSKIANVALHVTCLGADGVLVAGGARLCHYDHEGTLRSERSTPDRSAIVAPPAPAPDGTLYLATASGVFALR
ncbi:MAG: hypothetical protein K0V04_42275, partial [Deltaproteobacteria bacterium]|nr:hypothetical protein [Deltaproteobacteria bacterium]